VIAMEELSPAGQNAVTRYKMDVDLHRAIRDLTVELTYLSMIAQGLGSN
jgi:hypothetical protein